MIAPGARRSRGVPGGAAWEGPVSGATVRSASAPGVSIRVDTAQNSTGGTRMTRRVLAAAVVALALSAGVLAQGNRPASPAGTAATQVQGKYDTSGAEPVYRGGKWLEITYGRPIRRGREVFGGA